MQSYGGYGGGGYGGYQTNLLRHRGGYSSDQHLDYYAGGTGTSAYDTRKVVTSWICVFCCTDLVEYLILFEIVFAGEGILGATGPTGGPTTGCGKVREK